MSKLQKLYQRIKNNPKAVRFEELDKILRSAGFAKRQPKGGSSHHIYVKGDKMLSVPYKQPHIKSTYVERAIELIGDCFDE
ncbi:toxin HicA [Peptococcaceae bacterium 1198_IL3148]